MMLPVLQTAQAKAMKTLCASNLKQVGTATLMYTDDNDEALMRQGANIIGTKGDFCHGEWGGGGAIDYREPMPYGWGTGSMGLYNPVSAFVCPSNPRTKAVHNNSYGFMTGSASNFRMTIPRLMQGLKKAQKSQGIGWVPQTDHAALWGEYTCAPEQSDYKSLVNHKGGRLAVDGGNVVHQDGSVRWYPWTRSEVTWPQKAYTYMYAHPHYYGGTGASLPTSALVLIYGGSWNVDWNAAAGVYFGAGRAGLGTAF